MKKTKKIIVTLFFVVSMTTPTLVKGQGQKIIKGEVEKMVVKLDNRFKELIYAQEIECQKLQELHLAYYALELVLAQNNDVSKAKAWVDYKRVVYVRFERFTRPGISGGRHRALRSYRKFQKRYFRGEISKDEEMYKIYEKKVFKSIAFRNGCGCL